VIVTFTLILYLPSRIEPGEVENSKGRLVALPIKVRLGLTLLIVQNTLAYYSVV
jgi:hypothetical protein